MSKRKIFHFLEFIFAGHSVFFWVKEVAVKIERAS